MKQTFRLGTGRVGAFSPTISDYLPQTLGGNWAFDPVCHRLVTILCLSSKAVVRRLQSAFKIDTVKILVEELRKKSY